MAGVTDRPFRVLCRSFGAGLAASEMITSDTRLWNSSKSRHRMNHAGEPEPRVVQLAGADPAALAEAARINVQLGAQIIDLNMGCPAKKVCGKLCGSALLTDEPLVARILAAVVGAVDVPVTLKIRTGWDREHRNGVNIACIAQASGIAALAVHGRTRTDFYAGAAEYETIRAIKARVNIPVFANGDVTSAEKARESTPTSEKELRRRHFCAPMCVILFWRISTPSISFTARRPESGSRENISAGIASNC
jgi:tRNA-dihydrouridine synthase B